MSAKKTIFPTPDGSSSSVIKEVKRNLSEQDIDLTVSRDGEEVDLADLTSETVTFFTQAHNPTGPKPIIPIHDNGTIRWFYVDGDLSANTESASSGSISSSMGWL